MVVECYVVAKRAEFKCRFHFPQAEGLSVWDEVALTARVNRECRVYLSECAAVDMYLVLDPQQTLQSLRHLFSHQSLSCFSCYDTM